MSDPTGEPVQPSQQQEVAEVIAGLEQYRQRIIDDALKVAGLAKVPRRITMGHLEKHPEILQIDTMLDELRSGRIPEVPTSSTGP